MIKIKDKMNFISIFMTISLISAGVINEFLSCAVSVVLCVYFGYLIFKDRKILFYINLTCISVLTIVLFYGISAFWAVDSGAAVIGFFKFLPLILFLIALMQQNNEPDDFLQIVPCIAAGMTVVSALLMQIPVLERWFSVAGRLSGFFQYSNTFALFLLIALIIVLTKNKYKYYDFLQIPILIFGIVYSGSRTVFALMLVSVLVLILFLKNKKIKIALLVTMTVIISGVLAYVYVTGNVHTIGRFLTTSLTESTFVGRLLYFRDAFTVIIRHPFGIGYLGFYYMQESIQTGVYSVMFVHNDFLQLLLDIGWIPALLFISAIVKSFFKKGSTLRKRLLLFVISAHCCFDFDLQYIAVFMLLLIILDYKDGMKKTVIAPKRLLYVILSAIIVLCSYIGIAQFCSSFGFYDLSSRLYPWNTQDKIALLSAAQNTDEMKKMADDILEQNPYISVAYSTKAECAYFEGDFEKVIEYQNKAIELSFFFDNEYEKYCRMLANGADFYARSGDNESAKVCKAEFKRTVEKFQQRAEKLSYFGKMIKDQPTTELTKDIVDCAELIDSSSQSKDVSIEEYVRSGIVYDVAEQKMLFSKNPDERIYPASLVKLVTACTALKYVSKDMAFTVGTELQLVNPESSLCYIQEGQRLTLESLICGMLIPSGGDAAYTIAVNTARTLAGSKLTDEQAISYFCELMNKFAAEQGMVNSHFTNPDGWDDDNQYSTASDLLKIAEYIENNAVIKGIVGCDKKRADLVSDKKIIWQNTNLLLDKGSRYYYPFATGMKTGTTDKAGMSLIASAERNGKTVIVIGLGCPTDEQRYQFAIQMFSKAFSR